MGTAPVIVFIYMKSKVITVGVSLASLYTFLWHFALFIPAALRPTFVIVMTLLVCFFRAGVTYNWMGALLIYTTLGRWTIIVL